MVMIIEIIQYLNAMQGIRQDATENARETTQVYRFFEFIVN